LGETGTGKEVVARAIHDANPRGQFVPIDCGSLVGSLMESELFGHVKGAFSGAIGDKKGLVEIAAGGTAFFDEIGDLPLDMQVKLLRLLQEREFRAVGALHWKKIDVRILAATHRDLKTEVKAGRFRADLYYRLNVFTIRIPPLRERKQDIPLLIEHFLRSDGLPPFDPPAEIMNLLLSYDWPGNVRELKHCMERMAALHSEGAQTAELPSALLNYQDASSLKSLAGAVVEEPEQTVWVPPKSPVIPVPRSENHVPSMAESEEHTIRAALAAARGVKRDAAGMLGIGRTTLYRKMKQYGIE
jgi:transcriptional regulator with GAF, ATPase, and Fis domain